MMCLDVELRRRNKNTFGACDLMAELVRQFSIESDEEDAPGVDYNDIRTATQSVPRRRFMGPFWIDCPSASPPQRSTCPLRLPTQTGAACWR